MNHIKIFNLHNDYQTYIDSSTKLLPNISYCKNINDFHVNHEPVIVSFHFTVHSDEEKILFIAMYIDENEFNRSFEYIEIIPPSNNTYFLTFNDIVPDPDFSYFGVQEIGNYTINCCIKNYQEITYNQFFFTFASFGNDLQTTVTLPKSIIKINGLAFMYDFISSINIPNKVNYIGERAFAGNMFTTIGGYNDNNVSLKIPLNINTLENGIFTGCGAITSLHVPDNILYIKNNVFENCFSLTNVILSNNLISIGNEAFKSCTSLTTIIIPNSVQTIEDNAFSECNSLANITLSNNIKTIGDYAFYLCDLTSIIIPSSITLLGQYIFNGNDNLSSIIIYAETPPEQNYSFDDINENVKIYVPANCVEDYQDAWPDYEDIIEAIS